MSGTRFVPADLIDLALLTVGKRGRRRLDEASGKDATDFYEEFFTDVDESVMGSGEDQRKNVRLGGVRDAVLARVKRGDKVLDVGCGCGDNLRSLSDVDGISLYGVEFARSNCRRARRVVAGRASVVQGSAMTLPFATHSFDALTCIEVLEHLPDDRAALREMRRVLKPAGFLVLTVPHRHWFPAYRDLMGHERHYDRSGLDALMRSEGFVIEDHIPNYPRWHRAADYAYAFCRAAGIVSGRLGGDAEPQHVRIPGSQRSLLSTLNGMLEPLREADGRIDYKQHAAATSVVARLAS